MCKRDLSDLKNMLLSPAEALNLLLVEMERLRAGDELLKQIHQSVVIYGEGTLPNDLYAKLDNFVMDE